MPVTTRTRRTQSARVYSQIDSDAETDERPLYGEDENVDVEVGDVDVEDEDEDEDEGDDDDEEEDSGDQEQDGGDEEPDDEVQSDPNESTTGQQPQVSSLLPPSNVSLSSRLKIKLKLPSQPLFRYESPEVDSEDDEKDDVSHIDEGYDSLSRVGATRTQPRSMTTRQAVLASVLDSSHVSLTATRQKKPPLNEMELALRKEETARKRRNLTEKKLQDEKAETINRLLKKQSRPRNKRTTALSLREDEQSPSVSGASHSISHARHKRSSKKTTVRGNRGDRDVEDDEVDAGEDEEGIAMDVEDRNRDGDWGEEWNEAQRQAPTMYRWVSSIPRPEEGEGGVKERQMRITFSVPVTALPVANGIDGDIGTLHGNGNDRKNERPTSCAAPGCGKPFRYRLVKDWTRGACGMSCLEALEALT